MHILQYDYTFDLLCLYIYIRQLSIICSVCTFCNTTIRLTFCVCIVSVRHGLKDVKKMEELQMKVIDCLRDHCTYNAEAQRKPNFFSLILGKIAELRWDFMSIIMSRYLNVHTQYSTQSLQVQINRRETMISILSSINEVVERAFFWRVHCAPFRSLKWAWI